MSNRRAWMLREMGIGPEWHLRGAVAVPAPDSEALSATMPGATLAQPTDGDGRRADIMHMDWMQLKACVSACTHCVLHARRNKTVFGVGDEKADWLFVGEGPGADEDMQGEPFVGQAGKLLDSMLAAVKLK